MRIDDWALNHLTTINANLLTLWTAVKTKLALSEEASGISMEMPPSITVHPSPKTDALLNDYLNLITHEDALSSNELKELRDLRDVNAIRARLSQWAIPPRQLLKAPSEMQIPATEHDGLAYQAYLESELQSHYVKDALQSLTDKYLQKVLSNHFAEFLDPTRILPLVVALNGLHTRLFQELRTLDWAKEIERISEQLRAAALPEIDVATLVDDFLKALQEYAFVVVNTRRCTEQAYPGYWGNNLFNYAKFVFRFRADLTRWTGTLDKASLQIQLQSIQPLLNEFQRNHSLFEQIVDVLNEWQGSKRHARVLQDLKANPATFESEFWILYYLKLNLAACCQMVRVVSPTVSNLECNRLSVQHPRLCQKSRPRGQQATTPVC